MKFLILLRRSPPFERNSRLFTYEFKKLSPIFQQIRDKFLKYGATIGTERQLALPVTPTKSAMLIYVRYHNRQSTTLFHLQCWRYRFCRLTGKRHIGLCMHARLPRELKRFDATIRNFSVIPVTETEKGERPRNFVNVRKFSLSTLCDGRKSENVKTVMSSTKKQSKT